MSQPEENAPTRDDGPGKWSETWAKAEAAAEEYENGGSDEHASEQEAEYEGSQGSDDDGSEESEAGGSEEQLQSAEEAEGSESESHQRSEEREGSGSSRHDRKRKVPRGRRVRRELQERPEVDPEKLSALKEQAEQLGLTVEDGYVSTSERVNFRAERRELKKKLADREAQLEAEYRRHSDALQEQYGSAARMQELLDARDFDGLAKMAGYEDFGQMTVSHVKRKMSPEQQELMKMRAELQKERREREAYAQARQREQQERTRQAHIAEYKTELKDELLTSEVPEISEFANEPQFVELVFETQRKHWNPEQEQTISSDEAGALVIQALRSDYERMGKRFGSRAASKPEKQPTGRASAESRRGRIPTTVSQSEAADASREEDESELNEAAWAAKWGKEIKESTPMA